MQWTIRSLLYQTRRNNLLVQWVNYTFEPPSLSSLDHRLPGFQIRLRYQKLNFVFPDQNICCGFSKGGQKSLLMHVPLYHYLMTTEPYIQEIWNFIMTPILYHTWSLNDNCNKLASLLENLSLQGLWPGHNQTNLYSYRV